MTASDSSPTLVAFCITELDPGGAERALVQLVTRLDRNVWSPIVIALGPETPIITDLLMHGIHVHCLGAKGVRSAHILLTLIGILREFRPRILQTWMFHANILGRIAASVVRVPYVFSGIRVAEHSARWHNWMERRTRGLVSHHICVSHDVAKFAIKHHRLKEESVSVVPNGVEWERFAHAIPEPLSQFGIPDGLRTMLGVGRLHPQKGWLTLLEAAEPSLKADLALHLLIVGEGPQRRTLEKWVTKHQLEQQVHLPGWQSDVAGIMRSCELFILPSQWEGMPNVLLEAMASGLPIVATDVAGVAECLPPDRRDQLIKPNDATGLSAGLAGTLSNPAEASDAAQSLQLHVSETFTWSNSARIWSEIAALQSKL